MGEILARKLCRCLLPVLCLHFSTEAHGIRTADSLRRYCGLSDPQVLEKEAARFEMEIINASKKEGRQGIVPVPGAKEAVRALEVRAEPVSVFHLIILSLSQKASSTSEKPLWAVCTSGQFAMPVAFLVTDPLSIQLPVSTLRKHSAPLVFQTLGSSLRPRTCKRESHSQCFFY